MFLTEFISPYSVWIFGPKTWRRWPPVRPRCGWEKTSKTNPQKNNIKMEGSRDWNSLFRVRKEVDFFYIFPVRNSRVKGLDVFRAWEEQPTHYNGTREPESFRRVICRRQWTSGAYVGPHPRFTTSSFQKGTSPNSSATSGIQQPTAMPAKSIFFPLWFAICRRIRKQSAAKGGWKKERVILWEAKRQREKEELQERNSECAAPFIKATLN